MLYLSLRQYEYVCAIGHHGSLSAAAQQLNVSQPALSTALTRVESHLGFPLFTRRRGAAMAITPQGRTFLTQAEALLADAARLEGADHQKKRTTRLRLGCFTDLAPLHLAPALQLLRQSFPDAEISYCIDGFEGVITGLLNGQTDIAITYELGLDAGFSRKKLYDSAPNALIPTGHPLCDLAHLGLSDLAEHPLILSDEGLSAHHMLGLFRRSNLRPLVAHRAASLEVLQSLVAHGEGIGISYSILPGDIRYGRDHLISCAIDHPEAIESVVLTRHGTGPADPLIAAAEGILTDVLKQR